MVLNNIQFLSIKAGVDKLIKKGYHVDFYCPISYSNDGFTEMFSDLREYLKQNKYNVYSSVKNYNYHVLLEPYPMMDIKAKYKIKYFYGLITTKPSVSINPFNFLKYDCILCSGKFEQNYLQVYGNTKIIANMKFINYKAHKNNKKKILLYLPTYGEGSSIDEIYDELNNLRKYFYVIAKIHHGTTYLKNEKERIAKIKGNVDEFYESYDTINSLYERADIVLTDNSGAIFDAIYLNIPVTLFSRDVNKYKLGDFDTPQKELVDEGIILHTNEKEKILYNLKKTLNTNIKTKQVEWNKKNFYHPKDKTKDFIKVIEDFINENVNKRYIAYHNILQEEFYKMKINIYNLNNELKEQKNKINDLNEDINGKNNDINNLKQQLSYYENGKLYKLSKFIYKTFKRY